MLFRILYIALFALITLFSLRTGCPAVIIDDVAAFVDNEAITMGELEKHYRLANKINFSATRLEVLNNLINRFLLLREASRLHLEAKDDESLINEYITLKLKALVYVSEDEISAYYEKNREEFSGMYYFEVRDRIEKHLHDTKVEGMLERHIDELRSKSYIKILLTPKD
jgi:hypothetical protein